MPKRAAVLAATLLALTPAAVLAQTTPESAQAVANSSAPNRLPLSVIATAGIRSALHRPASSLILIAPAESEYAV